MAARRKPPAKAKPPKAREGAPAAHATAARAGVITRKTASAPAAPVQAALPLETPPDTLPELRRLAHGLNEAIRELRLLVATARPQGAASTSSTDRDEALEAAANCMTEAHQTIRAALATLPRDPEYSKVARQLREIASVSPSLTEWLSEVPKLTMPLGTSIQVLEAAAESLEEGELALRRRA